MPVLKGHLIFSDGREYIDLWSDKEAALSYYERSPYYEGCIRAELLELHSDGTKYDLFNCLYEYDVNGNYYYLPGNKYQKKHFLSEMSAPFTNYEEE